MAPDGFEFLADAEAFARTSEDGVRDLTRAAIGATFYREGMTPEQLADNQRIVDISGPIARDAAAAGHQHFAAAFAGERLAGFVIATRHAPDSHELDWLMVHPDFHGTPVSKALMDRGMAWLGTDRPMWLNVIRFNERAIRFYRRFGFEIDPDTFVERSLPQWIMRRPADAA